MSTITLELAIRNTTAEVEVTLTGDYDLPKVKSVTLCDGLVDLDIDTLFLLMGQSEWLDFVNEAIDKRNAQPVEEVPDPFGRTMNNGR